MKKLLVLSFLIFCVVSCSREIKEETIEESQKYELIQIQFYPSFLGPSLLTCDLGNNKVLFQRVGFRNGVSIIHGQVFQNTPPNTSYYEIDSLDISFLKDSILHSFTEADFQDMEDLGTVDGIMVTIILTDSKNKVKDFELMNNATNNQHSLILKLLEISQKEERDSLNLKYLERLEAYF